MLYLFEQVNFLEYLPFAKIVLHVVLLYRFNCYLLTCQLVDPESNFAKGSFSNELDEFVEVQSCRRQLIVLFYILLNVLDQVVPFLQNSIIYFWRRFCCICIMTR